MPVTSNSMPAGDKLVGKSLQDLLRLIGDEEKGCRSEAMEHVRRLGLVAVYDELEAAVRDDMDADLRNGAMDMLVSFGPAALPRLMPLLRDGNEEVRNFSAVMLGRIGSGESVGPLIEALRDPDMNVQHAAAEALGLIGDRSALLPLLSLLQGDFWQQCPAIYAMGELRDERAVPYLLPLVQDVMLAVPAMEALGKIGDQRVLVPLIRIINDPSGHNCAAAAKAVAAIIGPQGQPLSAEGINRLQQTLAPQGVTNLLYVISRPTDRESVTAAVTLLAWRQEVSALPGLLALLEQDGYIELVEGAIITLGEAVIPSLWDALDASFMDVRIVALRVLRWLSAVKDPKRMLPLLEQDAPAVQREVLATLAGSWDEELLPLVVRLVRDGDFPLRRAALDVLAPSPSSSARALLRELAASDRGEQRRDAAYLAGAMAEGGVETLLALMDDADAAVRQEAFAAAGRRRLREALPLLRQGLRASDQGVRETAILALGACEDAAELPGILAQLEGADERICHAVVTAVGRIGSPEAAPALIGLIGTGSLGRRLEFAIIDALGHLGPLGVDVVQALKGFLGHMDSDIRRLAVSTLARVAGCTAAADFAVAATDPHWSVRICALDALADCSPAVAGTVLKRALNDTDPMVRKHAAAILGRRRELGAITPLVMMLADSESGRAAFDSLQAMGEEAVPELHRVILDGPSPPLLERLIDLLGRIGNGASVDILLPCLESPDAAIRLAVIDSLVLCVDRIFRSRLGQVAQSDADGEVRRRAELVLKTISLEHCN